jgi:hypothetical protein
VLLLTAFFTGHNIVNKFKNEDNWAIAQIDNLHHEHNRFYNGFCMLTIGEKRLNYVGKCESVRGWKHRMQTSLIGASCWIFCKALRVFPTEMWTVQIVESITDNILQEEDKHSLRVCPHGDDPLTTFNNVNEKQLLVCEVPPNAADTFTLTFTKQGPPYRLITTPPISSTADAKDVMNAFFGMAVTAVTIYIKKIFLKKKSSINLGTIAVVFFNIQD